MDKIYISDDDSDTEVELEPDDGKELNFNTISDREEEHSFEEDFDRELPELEPDADELLDDDDIELLEMEKDYQAWLKK